MAAEAVGHSLDKGRALAFAGPVHCFPSGVHNFEDVHAVYLAGRVHAVDRGEAEDVGSGEGVLYGGTHAVAVVFAEEDYWKVPEGGQVEGFVELALVDGAIAEEAEGHAVIAQVLGR